MAEQASRVYRRKRIKFSGTEGDHVDVPVIYEAYFKTMAEQAQERFLYFDNSSKSSRKTHVKRVYHISNGAADTDGSYIDVERIDEWYVRLAQEQGQDYAFYVTNHDPPPIQPDGSNNPAHEKVHYVRYFKDNDSGSGPYVDCELIDELKIKDAVSQAQEWIFYMRHPTVGNVIDDPDVPYIVTEGYCDTSLELAPDEVANGIDPAWRLDPFQNIVNVGGGEEQTGGSPVIATVGVSVPGALVFSESAGKFAVAGSTTANGPATLSTWKKNKNTGVWTPAGGAIAGTLSGAPPAVYSGSLSATGSPPYTPFYSIGSNGPDAFGINNASGVMIGPYELICSSCTFTCTGRTYTFEDVRDIEASGLAESLIVRFDVLLSFEVK